MLFEALIHSELIHISHKGSKTMLEKKVEITLNHCFLAISAGMLVTMGLYPAIDVMFPSITKIDPFGIVASAIIGVITCFVIAFDINKLMKQEST